MSIERLKSSETAIPTADSADNVYTSDVIGNKSDTTGGDSIVSLLKIIDGLVDTVATTTPVIVSRSAANLPQTTQTAYFTVTGRVLVTQIVGEVTTIIETQDNDTKLIANPTVGADVDLCTALNITADAVGTIYTITGTLADAMVATTSGAVTAQASAVLVAAGTIDLDCAASNTGATKWTLHYIPLDSGSTVTAT